MKGNQYPVGKYESQSYSAEQLKNWLIDIETLPQKMEYALYVTLNLNQKWH